MTRPRGVCRSCFLLDSPIPGCERCANSARASAKSKRKRAAKIARRQRDTPLALDRSIGKKQRRVDYATFINSAEWAAIRVRLWEQQGRFCAACGSTLNLHVHHMTYERFGGAELLTDLVGLCSVCHETIHAQPDARGKKLREVTLRFIERKSPAPVSASVGALMDDLLRTPRKRLPGAREAMERRRPKPAPKKPVPVGRSDPMSAFFAASRDGQRRRAGSDGRA